MEKWKLVTSVKKEEQTIIVLLESLDCNAKVENAVSELTTSKLYTNDGMDILTKKLDSIFQSEIIDSAYSTCSKFRNYKRNDNEDISDYIIEYEQMTDFDMRLPDPVLTFKVFDDANLSNDNRKLALALGNDMKFENLKSTLNIFFQKPSHHIMLKQTDSCVLKKKPILQKTNRKENNMANIVKTIS